VLFWYTLPSIVPCNVQEKIEGLLWVHIDQPQVCVRHRELAEVSVDELSDFEPEQSHESFDRHLGHTDFARVNPNVALFLAGGLHVALAPALTGDEQGAVRSS
jgi:hypothetical protein